MLKNKRVLLTIFVAILVFLIPNMVNATEKQTTTSTINGVSVNWEYELNESNQVENLKCTNVEVLSGSISIPSTIDEKTVVSIGNEAFESSTGITEVTIPSSIKEIGLWAFSGCTSLAKVDLGNVEKINDQSFKNCTALTSIRIPKTLSKDASGAPFLGCTNLKNIELEEGMTVVPNCVCATTPITEITIPSSVKEIGMRAFSGCTSLAKVDLGNVEKINDQSFKNCTALTSIKIPKTLSKNATGAPFTGCTNLKTIVLEEGMTVVPTYVCATTPITEITIPSSVNEIGMWAFSGCTSLKKITILDNVKDIEGYNSSASDLVFQNHNDDLTIYCYEDSMAAKYAIKYNIKYVYLQRPSTDGNKEEENKQNNEEKKPENAKPENTKKDNTTAPGNIPYTGGTFAIILTTIGIIAIGVYAYKRNNDLKGI